MLKQDASYSKTRIFKPLGLNSFSFYLTPELKERHVPLAIRTPEGENVLYNGQFPIMELDYNKGMSFIVDGQETDPLILSAQSHSTLAEVVSLRRLGTT